MNRKLKLTVSAIEKLPRESRQYIAWDTELQGFGALVSKTTIAYFITYRLGSRLEGHQEQKHTIARHGDYFGMSEAGESLFWTPTRARKKQLVLRQRSQRRLKKGHTRKSDGVIQRAQSESQTFGQNT